MKKLLLLSALLLPCALALHGRATGHGGTYRGPGDTVPPGAGGGGSGVPGPATGPGVPGVPGPTGPGSGTPGGVGTPAGPGATPGAGGGTPVTGGSSSVGPDLTVWDFWWGFNKDPYLDLRAHVRSRATLTGSDDFYLGRGQATTTRDTLAPTEAQVRDEVVPALLDTLARESQPDIVTGCLMALAKIGDVADEGQGSVVQETLHSFLSAGNQEVRETAALALGVLGDARSIPILVSLMRDGPEGRRALQDTQVPLRTRAFATYGLGLIGHRTGDNALRTDIAAELVAVLDSPQLATRDLKVAAMIALGLTPVDPAPVPLELGEDELGDPRARVLSRQRQVDYVLDYFDHAGARAHRDTRHWFVRAHAPRTAVRLLRDAPEADFAPLHARAAELLLAAVRDRTRRRGYEQQELEMGATLALGQLGDARDDGPGGPHTRIREALLQVAERGEQQSRRFALISLAQVSARPGPGEDPWAARDPVRENLVRRLSRGNDLLKPWAGLALGVHNAALRELDQPLHASSLDALRAKAADCRRPSEVGAYLLGLGLSADPHEGTREVLLDKLEFFAGDDVARGYACVALGLVGDPSAIEAVQDVLLASRFRPGLLRDAAVALGLLGDKTTGLELVNLLSQARGMATQAALATALGQIGDRDSVAPLLSMLHDDGLTASARGFAAVALGTVCDPALLPWNSHISTDLNYRANTATLTGQGLGVLDIL